jgi:hypothetical protein
VCFFAVFPAKAGTQLLPLPFAVIPAKAGTQAFATFGFTRPLCRFGWFRCPLRWGRQALAAGVRAWVPAFAGMTRGLRLVSLTASAGLAGRFALIELWITCLRATTWA